MSRPPSASIFRSPRKTNSSFYGIRPSRWQQLAGRTAHRAGAFLALFAIIATVFYAGTSSAASLSPKGATESSPVDSSRPAQARYDFSAWLLPATMFQTHPSLVETVNTYAADCSTPKTDFNLGDTVCARATFPSAFLSFRRINWINPDNNILDSAFITSNTQTDLFTLPATGTSVVGGATVDNRGTWRIDLRSFGGSRRATASFDVHDVANPRADLQVFAVRGEDTVETASNVQSKVIVYNAGPDTATNVQVTAPSVAGLSLQSFTPVAGADCGSTCTIASLSPGNHAVFIATYSVTAAAGTRLSVTLSVTSDTGDPRPTNNSETLSYVVASASSGSQTCTLTPPAPITVNGSESPDPNDPEGTLYGAVVNYQVGAEGEGCEPVQCDTPSGSFFPVGTTNVTCTAGSGEFTIFPVTVNDTRSFRINLNGANPLTVECNSIPPFADPGATTNRAGITPTAVSTVNPNAPNTYTITYTATDDNGTPNDASDDIVATPVVRTVNVVDDSPPLITLNGDNPATDEIETQELTVECHGALPDLGATANDACDGPAAVSVNGSVDPNTVGTYTLTYTATDNHGTPGDPTDDLVATITRTIHVVDTTAPVITLNGASSMTVECQTGFNDPGASATDSCDINVSVTAAGSVDAATPGAYTITYTASDAAGNAATPVTRTVNVVDATGPVITLNGDSTMTVECHASYADAGATANDACGGSVSVTSSGSVDVNTPGTYTITYTATDGTNTSTATRTVHVVDTTAPIITLNGANSMTVECHTSFTDPGASAADSCDTSVPVTPSGSVNVDVPGTYTITYTASDDSGNAAASVTRTVNVVDTTAPTINCPANIVVNLPANSAATTVPVNFNVTASDSCSTTATVTTSHASGANFPVGTTTVTATATDAAGNTSTCTFDVTVHYLFTGFFSPISNLPTVNTVKAGSAIPIKFSLSGYKGLNIFAIDSPASGVVTCNSSDPAVDLTEIDTPGNSGLTYNAGSDQYHYNWKTLKAWENTCRQLVVKLNDGTEHRANFKFK